MLDDSDILGSDPPKRRPGRPPANLPRGATANPDLLAEKIRLAKEQADKTALANAKARGELLPAAEVEREWAAILRDVRAAMLALPSRLQQKLPHLSAHDVAMIDREIRDVLAELGNSAAQTGPTA
jgi:phage terminase Nu1 subunit (DNA packaging protein)